MSSLLARIRGRPGRRRSRMPARRAGYAAAVRQGLQGRYPAAVAIALLALVPNSVLTTAYTPILPVLTADLDTSEQALQLAEGLSNAGLALGALFAAFLAQRFVQRRLFVGYLAGFVAGSCLAALAPGLTLFAVGRVVQGTATGMMVISALPVLVTRFPASRLPLSVVFVNVALFGATTVGPLVAGPVAASGSWRLLFGATVGVGVLGWLTTLVGYEAFDPQDPERRMDRPAMTLAVVGTVLLFCATSILPGDGFGSPVFWLPFVVGIAALVGMVVVEYRSEDPLVPVRALTTQLPVTGTIVAMVGGAVFVAVLGLAQLYLADVARAGPTEAAGLFWPMPLGLLLAAVLFGVALPTRWLAALVNAGLLALLLAAVVLVSVDRAHPAAAVLPAAALLGFGAGASVSPGAVPGGDGGPVGQARPRLRAGAAAARRGGVRRGPDRPLRGGLRQLPGPDDQRWADGDGGARRRRPRGLPAGAAGQRRPAAPARPGGLDRTGRHGLALPDDGGARPPRTRRRGGGAARAAPRPAQPAPGPGPRLTPRRNIPGRGMVAGHCTHQRRRARTR